MKKREIKKKGDKEGEYVRRERSVWRFGGGKQCEREKWRQGRSGREKGEIRGKLREGKEGKRNEGCGSRREKGKCGLGRERKE